jgi:hypothetical protein
MAWGGEEEQREEIRNGNPHARNWYKEAVSVVEATVRPILMCFIISLTTFKMERYYQKPTAPPTIPNVTAPDPAPPRAKPKDDDALDDYDRARQKLVKETLCNEGWRTELSRYLADIPDDVTRDTDIIAWWGVSLDIDDEVSK